MKEVQSQKIKTSGLKTLLALGKRMNHDMTLHLKLTNYAKEVCLYILKRVISTFYTLFF